MLQKIYAIDGLQELKDYLSGFKNVESLRAELFSSFLSHSSYRNASEWNKAVRLCECLAITGWGDKEAVEAVRSPYFNGNPNTYFINRNSEPRFLDAVWSKMASGPAIDFSRSAWHDSPDCDCPMDSVRDSGFGEAQSVTLMCQRNRIPKNPILITLGLANCYENSRAVIESMEKELMPELNRRMRPELYGSAVDRIVLNCSFSFYDNYHCKTNYIIADEKLRLKQKDFYQALLSMYSEKEIEDNGYFLRNRFTYGPFMKATGTTRIEIVLEKEFSDMPRLRQKQTLCDYFLHAVRHFSERAAKRTDYDFALMLSDFSEILHSWCKD